MLLGQNNEGKSNLLSALAAAMTVVSQLAHGTIVRGRIRFARDAEQRGLYRWDRDFPISLQHSQPDGESVFRLEFSLTEEERSDFKRSVGSNLNESLPIEIKIGKTDPTFKVVKRGPGSGVLNKKTQEVATFIGRRVEFTYIPAVRTAQAAVAVVQRMVSRELATLERDPAYRKAFEQIAALQQPILQRVSDRIGAALRDFLPNVRSVDVSMSENRRYIAMRREVEVTVDDGTPTALSRKGDGVQSLAAISLLRGGSLSERHLILALEEPESHLHPSAIHRLREVIDELSRQHQVVITTHCPLFVDRVHVDSNIVVTATKASPAKSIAEIRQVLGVRASDNLMHAYLVVVVEGESDRTIVQALAPVLSPSLGKALKANTLAVEHLHGAGKLNYKLSELTASLCNAHCLLDNDDAGRSAAISAQVEGLIGPADVHFLICQGMKDSELEDVIRPQVYADWVMSRYGVDVGKPAFRSSKKWTTRMADVFSAHGKQWSPSVAKAVKTGVAEQVAGSPVDALIPEKSSALQAFFEAIETRLAKAL